MQCVSNNVVVQFRARKIEKGLSLSLRDNACLHALFHDATSKVRRCTPYPVPCFDRLNSVCVLISTSRIVGRKNRRKMLVVSL